MACFAFSVGSSADVVRSKSLLGVARLTFDVKSRVNDMCSQPLPGVSCLTLLLRPRVLQDRLRELPTHCSEGRGDHEDFAPVFHDGIGCSCSGGAWPAALLSAGRYGASTRFMVVSSRVLLGPLAVPDLCALWQLCMQMCGANHLVAAALL